jgi:hypothetical protein
VRQNKAGTALLRFMRKPVLPLRQRTASCLRQNSQHIAVMSTLAEIEAAIAVLPAAQVDELAAWL